VGAAEGSAWLGPAVVALLVVIQVPLSRNPVSQLFLLGQVALLGTFVDSTLKSAGLFSYSADSFGPWVVPAWMIALWVNFGLTLRASMAWLESRYLLAALLGASGGPLAYWAGSRLGAMQVQWNEFASYGILALTWAAALPVLVYFAQRGRN
jgi:hypothetical protein